MVVSGRIEFGRELKFTEANDWVKLGCRLFELSSDGRAIQWSGVDGVIELELAFICDKFLFPKRLFSAAGVLKVVDGSKSYEVVLIKRMVKVLIGAEVVTIKK